MLKILLAIDGSPHSLAAARQVARHPWPAESEVRVITVDAPLGDSTLARESHGTPGNSAYEQLVRQQRLEAEQDLVMAENTVREQAPQLSVTSCLLEGTPKDVIVCEAREWGADLVVVGSQGKGALRSVLLGSVSLGVVVNAPCSVLVVREAQGVTDVGTSADAQA